MKREDTFTDLLHHLPEVTAPVATIVEQNTHFHNTHHFGRKDGPYLSRVVNMRHSPTAIAIYSYSEWSTIVNNSLWGLFESPGSAIEIQHTLQHFRNLLAVAPRVPFWAQQPVQPALPVLAPALAPDPTAPATKTSEPMAPPDSPPPTPPPRPASAPARVAFSAPLAMPMRRTTRSPPPIDGVGSVVVRMPL